MNGRFLPYLGSCNDRKLGDYRVTAFFRGRICQKLHTHFVRLDIQTGFHSTLLPSFLSVGIPIESDLFE